MGGRFGQCEILALAFAVRESPKWARCAQTCFFRNRKIERNRRSSLKARAPADLNFLGKFDPLRQMRPEIGKQWPFSREIRPFPPTVSVGGRGVEMPNCA